MGSQNDADQVGCAQERPLGSSGAAHASTSSHGGTSEARKGKKRKIALFLGYVGAGYSGMQRNQSQDTKTIEEELENAIAKAGGISDMNAGAFTKVGWSRAARTDKGVSAMGQVVSLKMVLDPPGIMDRINDHLPAQIRAFGYTRVTNGFCSWRHCDRRRYQYTVPAWVLDPDCRPDTCRFWSACAEGNVPGPMGETLDEVLPDGRRARLDGLLAQYVGTHNFCNFTEGMDADDPSSKRQMLSFAAKDVVVVEGVPHVRLEVVGQSFMLHQIRKMVGLAIAIMRGAAPGEAISLALEAGRKVMVPMAPAVGLLLVECMYESYNERFGITHERIDTSQWATEMEDFKQKWIYPQMVKEDKASDPYSNFIANLTEERFGFAEWASRPVEQVRYAKYAKKKMHPKERREMAKKRKGLDGWSDRGNEKEGGGDEGGEGGGAREEDQGVVEKGEKRARVTEEGEGKGEGKGERETA